MFTFSVATRDESPDEMSGISSHLGILRTKFLEVMDEYCSGRKYKVEDHTKSASGIYQSGEWSRGNRL